MREAPESGTGSGRLLQLDEGSRLTTKNAAEAPVFVDPHRTLRRGETNWYELLLPLTHPNNHGQWARVKRWRSSGAATGAMKRLRERRVEIPEPKGKWEFTTRKEGEGRSLYVRYTPRKVRKKT